MTTALRIARRPAVVLLCLLAGALMLMTALATPASAADVEVRLTEDGPVPAAVTLPQGGGTVLFVVDDLPSHTLTSDAFPEQRLGGVGEPRQVELEFRAAGTVGFVDRRNALVAPSEAPGTVTVPAPPPPAAQPPADQGTQPAAAPPPPRSGGTASSPPRRTAPTPARAPDERTAAPPSDPLVLAEAPPEPGTALPPALPGLPAETGAEPQAASELPPVQALKGPLPGEDTSRSLGLPAALAVLAAVGVASLLVRVLLAEPAARAVRGLTPVTVRTAS